MGIILAINDFSMGLTTLNYLRENLLDVIKIDGSLAKGLSSSPIAARSSLPSPCSPTRSPCTSRRNSSKAKKKKSFSIRWVATNTKAIFIAPPFP